MRRIGLVSMLIVAGAGVAIASCAKEALVIDDYYDGTGGTTSSGGGTTSDTGGSGGIGGSTSGTGGSGGTGNSGGSGGASSSSSGTGGSGGTGGTSSSSSGTSTSSSSSGSGNPCGDYVYSTDPVCHGCVETSCCSQLLACDTGTPCADLLTCLETCGANDQNCIDGCLMTYGAGVPAAQALIQCADASCAGVCTTGGVCNSGLTYGSDVMDQCLTSTCCPSFNACEQDVACNACLMGTGTNCSSNPLFVSYDACHDTFCPSEFCDSGIGYVQNPDPMIQCNLCVDANCCSDLASCVALGNGCLDCLLNPSVTTCGSQTVVNDIAAFNLCVSTNCSTECT